MLVYPMLFIIRNMDNLTFVILLLVVVCILIIIIVGSILIYRSQTSSLQIKIEKARHEIEKEISKNSLVAEYRSKILDCIKSTKAEDYADKEKYINKIEEYLKTL